MRYKAAFILAILVLAGAILGACDAAGTGGTAGQPTPPVSGSEPAGNSSGAGEGQKGYEEPIQVLGVVMTMDHTFQQQVAAGWALPVEINGVTANVKLYVEDPQGAIEKEIQITETYMKQGIDAWVGYPLNSEAMAPVAKEMKEKGIFMLTEGNTMPNQTMGMITDERDGGLLGGEMFVKWWTENRPGEIPYILVLDDPTSEAFQRKPDAFVEYVNEHMPEAVILGQQDADMQVEKAMNIVSTFILSNPEMNFVFCGVDSNAIGAMAAIESAGRTDIAIAGCGGEDNILPFLYQELTPQKGGYAFEVAYEKSPIELGHLMMIGVCQLVMDYENTDYNIIDLGFTALDRSNIDEYVASKNKWLALIGEPPLEIGK